MGKSEPSARSAGSCVFVRLPSVEPWIGLATGDGLYKSEVFPGLWLNAAALIPGDMKTVQKTLEPGIASSEHQAFVAKNMAS
jgi:hypothetical protein